MNTATDHETETNRIGLVDEVRGLALVGMVVFHAIYDLSVIHIRIPAWLVWVLSTSGLGIATFVFISGAVCHLSRNNLRRGTTCLAAALGVSLVTYALMPDQIIAFGVLHCLGICMLLFPLLRPVLRCMSPSRGILLSIALFLMTNRVPEGRIGLPWLFSMELPRQWYQPGFLFPLGFRNADFVSIDYCPLLPWAFMFLAGSFFGIPLVQKRLPPAVYATRSRSLAFIGRHSLFVYLVHQPLILVVLGALLGVNSIPFP